MRALIQNAGYDKKTDNHDDNTNNNDTTEK